MLKRISLSFFTITFLTLVSVAILFCLALIAQFSGLQVFGNRKETALTNALQTVLTNRVRTFEKDLRQPLHELHAIRINPLLPAALGNAPARNAETLQGLFAARGFSAVQLQDSNKKPVFTMGKFTTAAQVVVPINLPDTTKLIWQQGWLMRVVLRLPQNGKQKNANPGWLTVEWPLSQTNALYANDVGLGEKGEFHICTLNSQDTAVCSPNRLQDEPLITPLLAQSKPTAMSYALAGQKGQMTALDAGKNEVLEAYMPIGTTGLVALANMPTTTFYAPMRQRLQVIIPLLFLCICFSMLWLYWKVSILVKKLSAAELQLVKMAYHDALTGLDNRNELEKNILFAIRSAHLLQHNLALIFLDLDYFKQINETLGHDGGDLLLQEVARRLTDIVSPTDKIGRLGGDEFVMVLTDFTEVSGVAALAEKILLALAQPMRIKDQQITITSSMGISIFPDDGLSMENLLEHADMALYRAKEFGKNNYQFFGGKVLQDDTSV